MDPLDGWTGDMTDHLDLDPLVGGLLMAATAPAEAPLPGERAALAAFRAVHPPVRKLRLLRPTANLKLMAAALGGGAVMVTGVAAAATGTLPLVGSGHSHHSQTPRIHPGTVQPTHGAHAHSPSQTTTGNGNHAKPADPTGTGQGQGSTISRLAHSPAPTDVPKGRTLCTAASQAKCHAHSQGTPGTPGHQGTPVKSNGSQATTHAHPKPTPHASAHASAGSSHSAGPVSG
jgi:hypothetical protein